MKLAACWRRCAIGLAALVVVCFAQADTPTAAARDLKILAPEAAGFSSQRLQKLDASMQSLTDSKQIAGIVTLAARHGKIVHWKSFGMQDLASGRPMPKDAIFRIYSMTKPVIGVAMMILHEEGQWQPGDPIAKFLPEFANVKVFSKLDANGQPVLEDPQHPPLMDELMTHSAGFTYGVFQKRWIDEQYLKTGIISPATLEFTTTLARGAGCKGRRAYPLRTNPARSGSTAFPSTSRRASSRSCLASRWRTSCASAFSSRCR